MLNIKDAKNLQLQLLEMNDERVLQLLKLHSYNITANSFKYLVMKASPNTYGGLKMIEFYSNLMRLKCLNT